MTKISKKLKHLVTLPLCVLFFFIGAMTVHAATRYVATTGSNTTCTAATNIGTPAQTIAFGLSCTVAGDTLYLRGGTYNESIDSNKLTIPTGTSYSDAPLISSYPSETVTLNGNINIAHTYVQYVEFARLVLTATYQNISVGGFEAPHHIKFTGMEVKDGIEQCVQLGKLSHHVWFTGGRIHDCAYNATSTPPGYPMYISGSDHLIENMEIYGSNSYCIHIYYSNTPKPAGVTVRNSVLHHCALKTASSAAIILTGGDSNAAYNNILYNNSGHGIINMSGTNTHIYNNTVYGGSQTGIYIQSAATNTDVRNNIAYGNATTQILNEGTGTILSKNLTSDPRFVNVATLNFNLQTSSPAINVGDFLSQVATDIKQTPRPQGGAYDIGAYEVSIGSDTAPPSSPVGLRVN